MKRCMLLLTCLLTALSLLSGCASGPDLKGQPFFTGPVESRPDLATVYFYRTAASVGYGVAPTITVDGKPVGSLPSGGYFKTTLPAGKYHIKSTTPPIVTNSVNKAFDLTVANGNVYFIADETSSMDFKDDQTLGEINDASFNLQRFYFRYALVPEEQALRSMKWCQQVPAAPQ